MATTAVGDDMAIRRKVDPITIEVMRAGLISIVREMTVTLTKTSYSTIIRDVHDFSCVLFDAKPRLVAQAEGIPVFNGSMNFVIDAVAAKYPLDEMKPGDIYITNDPYHGGGTHKNDINIVMPIFWNDELVMLSASKAHYLDIGGKDAGSWSPDARNSFQEGITIPPLKLCAEGRVNEAITDILFANVRVPELERGDLAAQLAAGKTAEARAHDLLEKYGLERFEDAVEEILDHGERTVRAAIERIPDGTYTASCYSDADGASEEPVFLNVMITVSGSDVYIDFAGSSDQRSGSSGNLIWTFTVSSCREAIMFFADTSMGANDGSYRPIHITAPRGSVFNPLPPAPVTTGIGDVGTRAIELIVQTFAQVLPDEVIAGTFGSVSGLTLSGVDPVTGAEFVHFSPYAGGWGGRVHADGNSAMVSLLSGDNYNIPCEVMETRFPGLLAEEFRLREGSGGAGRHRGGWGVAYDYRFLVPGEFTVALDRDKFPPYGLFGGQPGVGSGLVVGPGTPEEQTHARSSGVRVDAGTVISHRTAGGGGYGDPFERDPELVAEDVRSELVTVEQAFASYGVVVDAGSLVVDLDATRGARAARRG